MEVQVEETGAWVGDIFVRFDQPLEAIIKATVEATKEQYKSTAVSAFAEASRILKRSSSSIPVPKAK